MNKFKIGDRIMWIPTTTGTDLNKQSSFFFGTVLGMHNNTDYYIKWDHVNSVTTEQWYYGGNLKLITEMISELPIILT